MLARKLRTEFRGLITLSALVVFLIGNIAFAAAENEKFQIDADKSSVTFVAVGKPGFLRIKGEGAHVSGSGEIAGDQLQGSFQVQLIEFKTGIDLRDEHMKEKYLETSKYPQASLTIQPLKVSRAADGLPAYDGDFTGMLTVKGVEKKVSGTIRLHGESGRVTAEAKLKITLDDYNIGVPSHLGVTVAQDVEITVVASAIKISPKAQ
jgi:polyisoprenoid-binding protein YceI